MSKGGVVVTHNGWLKVLVLMAISTEILVGCVPPTAEARNIYHVATSGADRNPGTDAAPFATIAKAASTAAAGDTVIVQSGTYDEEVRVQGNGTASAPITFEANGTVVITGGFAPARWAGDDVDDPRASGNNYVTLKGFVFEHTKSFAIRASTGWSIENVTIRNSPLGINIRGDDATIANSTFKDINGTQAHALVGVGGTNIHILNNLIEHVNSTNQTETGNSAVTKFLFTKGLVVEGNTSDGNHGPGFWLDTENTRFIIVRNTFRNNTEPGLMLELNPNAHGTVAANIASGNGGPGIMIAESSGIELYGNTFANNRAGAIQFRNMDRVARGGAVAFGRGTQYVHDISIHDNIFNGGRALNLFPGGNFAAWAKPAAVGIAVQHNTWNGPVEVDWVAPNDMHAGATYRTIEQLQSMLGFETEHAGSSVPPSSNKVAK